MPQVTYTAAKGLVQSAGSGFAINDVAMTVSATSGLTSGGLFAGFIPNVAKSAPIASGAVSVASYFSPITVDGTKAFSLADGSAAGQLKKIMCTAAINTPVGNLTIASPISAAVDVITFGNAGDVAELMWTGSAWRILALYNVVNGGVASPTVG